MHHNILAKSKGSNSRSSPMLLAENQDSDDPVEDKIYLDAAAFGFWDGLENWWGISVVKPWPCFLSVLVRINLVIVGIMGMISGKKLAKEHNDLP